MRTDTDRSDARTATTGVGRTVVCFAAGLAPRLAGIHGNQTSRVNHAPAARAISASQPIQRRRGGAAAVGPGSENKVRAGHSWPAMSGMNWMMAHRLPGCAPGVRLTITPPGEQGDTVGGQGGWGGIYCFALTP